MIKINLYKCQICNGNLKKREGNIGGKCIFECIDCGKKYIIENGNPKKFKF